MLATVLFVAVSVQGQTLRRHGIAFSTNMAYNKQDNLDRVLRLNRLPNSSKFLFGFTATRMLRLNSFELAADFTVIGNQRQQDGYDKDRAASVLALNTRYLFGKNKTEWYPTFGIGYAGSVNRFSVQNSSSNINAALTTARNTTTLYNRQGIVNLGLGVRFINKPQHFVGVEAGYQLGFGTTPWSTSKQANYMTTSVTDELRQFYLRLVTGFYNKRKER